MDPILGQISELSNLTDRSGQWPKASLELLDQAQAYKWFIPESYGGFGWHDGRIIKGYIALAEACLTTAFILTQRSAACRRLVASTNAELKDKMLPRLLCNRTFATVGVSHLSTSRRHTNRPALTATCTSGGYVLDGSSWWVTGAAHADYILLGAEIASDQMLFWVPTEHIDVDEPDELLALNGAHTAAVHVRQLELADHLIVAGPKQGLMDGSRSGGTAGIHTSALAIGVANAATRYLGQEAIKRPNLRAEHRSLSNELETLARDLIEFADGHERFDKMQLRRRANALVLQASHGALRAAKGAGYLAGRDPNRWCREALFFQVWSAPSVP